MGWAFIFGPLRRVAGFVQDNVGLIHVPSDVDYWDIASQEKRGVARSDHRLGRIVQVEHKKKSNYLFHVCLLSQLIVDSLVF